MTGQSKPTTFPSRLLRALHGLGIFIGSGRLKVVPDQRHPTMNLPTATASERHYPRLLNDEPDLTPHQVWLMMATSGHSGSKAFHEEIVIADTADQVAKAVQRRQWTPFVIVNETELNAQIASANRAPAYVVKNIFGHAGNQLYALVFDTKDVQVPMRMIWVRAANARAADRARRQLGEKERPTTVLKYSDLVELCSAVHKVRLDRGDGAMTDARSFNNLAERVIQLAKERVGAEVWEEERRKFAALVNRRKGRVSPAFSFRQSLMLRLSLRLIAWRGDRPLMPAWIRSTCDSRSAGSRVGAMVTTVSLRPSSRAFIFNRSMPKRSAMPSKSFSVAHIWNRSRARVAPTSERCASVVPIFPSRNAEVTVAP